MKPKMNLLKFAPLLLLPFNLYAGDDPVNCKNVQVGVQKIYGGHVASCYTYIGGQAYSISQYVHFVPQRTFEIRGTVFTPSGLINSGCTATLYFHSEQKVYKEQCEYTPSASVSVFREEASSNAWVRSQGTDRDGTVVLKELWVNGVKRAGDTAYLTGNVGDTFSIKSKVTDDSGHTDEKNTTVTLIYRPVEMCGSVPC